MAERLRVWLAGGHECDLDLGDGSAQELMEKIENADDHSWFSTDDGRSRVRASAIVRIAVEGKPETRRDPVERRSSERGAHMPESGLPIRVYKEHDMWHVDYGEGVIEDHTSEEEATSAADAVAEAEERTVIVEE